MNKSSEVKRTVPLVRTNERQAGNCSAAANRARSYGKYALQSADLMRRASNYWRHTEKAATMAAIYAEQEQLYLVIAAQYQMIAERADTLASMFEERAKKESTEQKQ